MSLDWPLQTVKAGIARELEFPFAGVQTCKVVEHDEYIFLEKLVISEAYRGRGVGTRVLRELKRRGLPIRLVCFPDDPNRDADLIRFYQRNGFQEVEGSNAEMIYL